MLWVYNICIRKVHDNNSLKTEMGEPVVYYQKVLILYAKCMLTSKIQIRRQIDLKNKQKSGTETKKKIQMNIKHMKQCSVSFVMRHKN